MIKKILSIVITIVWMLLIFSFSSDNASTSSSLSDGIIECVIVTFTGIQEDSEEMEELVNTFNFPLRKCAHFFLYFVLGLLVANMLYYLGMNKYLIIVSSILCILYAISDETHQLFIDGRTGQVRDVFLDGSASLFANFLYYNLIYLKIIHKKNSL